MTVTVTGAVIAIAIGATVTSTVIGIAGSSFDVEL
jgi:hypothetical protein